MIRKKAALLTAALTILTSGLLRAESITCSSEDGGRHYCRVASDYTRVRLVRQRSGSRCDENYSWGSDERGIWVDHGCRADFDVDRSNYSASGDGAEQTLNCSSEDGGRHYCRVEPRSRVRMIRQRSGSACDEGRSWGVDSRGIWVDHGCRADFGVIRSNSGRYREVPSNDPDRGSIYNPNHGSADSQGREKTVNCSDESGHRTHCNAIVNGGVDLVRQRSGSPCRRDYSWGVDDSGIWVDHGCRADFVLHGVAADR